MKKSFPLITTTILFTLAACDFSFSLEDSSQLLSSVSDDISLTTSLTPTTSESPTTSQVSLPTNDVAGSDLPLVPRYPGSVRTEYIHDNGLYCINYLTLDTRTQVADFYVSSLPGNSWIIDTDIRTGVGWEIYAVNNNQNVIITIYEDDWYIGATKYNLLYTELG